MDVILGILKEEDDRRVSIIPESIKRNKNKQLSFLVESGAGEGTYISDEEYKDAGAAVESRENILKKAIILSSISPLSDPEYKKVLKGTHVVSSFAPFIDEKIADKLNGGHLYYHSMDMIPRSSIAQSMDVLSSMASIAGYKAVLIASERLLRYLPMLITSAGSIKPANVLVIGAGVAGLQAIATARRLGAVVQAMDTRAAVEEEIQSLGAKFIKLEGARDASAQGYGAEQTKDFLEKQRQITKEIAKSADIIICTAVVRGRKAPVIITADMVNEMKKGSVIVDIASATGGNCEVTKDKEEIVHGGITIVGDSELSKKMPLDASFLYGNNLLNFIVRFFTSEGEFSPDLSDDILASTCIAKPEK